MDWQWTGPNGYASSLEDPPAFPITPASTGTYIVRAMDNNGCINTANTVVGRLATTREVDKIPTLSEWGLIIYGLLVLNLCVVFIRRQQYFLVRKE